MSEIQTASSEQTGAETSLSRQTDAAFVLKKGAVKESDFIGREEELSFLDAAADASVPKHISIHGLPHIGKTSLVTEWMRRLEKRENRIPSGKALLVIMLTVNEFSGYLPLLRQLFRTLGMEVSRAGKAGRFPGEQADALRKELWSAAADKGADAGSQTQRLAAALKQIADQGLRTVLILDEFEAVARDWREEEYLSFVRLLLKEDTELFCIAVSRPHISYITGRFERQLSPFVPRLLASYSEEDLTRFFERIAKTSGVDLTEPEHAKELKQLLYSCGKNPYLLSLMERALLSDADSHSPANPEETYKNLRRPFRQHYHDVLRFVLTEEEATNRSFSHIIKCYFGTSADYEDILEGYIPLGYIECMDPASRFAEAFARFGYTDRETGRERYYVTVAPAFIDYLYLEALDEIRDVRDLLTGLLHTLRYITEKELAELFPAPKNWDEELLKRLRGHYQNDPSKDAYTDENSIVYPVKLPRGNWIWCKLPELRSGMILNRTNSPEEQWIKGRREWIENNDAQMIDLAGTSMRFAVEAYNQTGNDRKLAILDAVSLADHAAVLRHYANRFTPYFGVIGDLQDPDRFEVLENLLRHVQEEVRNPISHYSRRESGQQKEFEKKQLCIYLLRSIYSYLADGIVADQKPFAPGTQEDADAAHEARKNYRAE